MGKKYQGLLEEHNKKIKQVCSSVGATFYTANTDQNVFDVFYDVLGRQR